MKNLHQVKTKIILFVTAFLLSSAASFSQGATAYATATATIVTPISITKTIDLNFGNIAVDSIAGGGSVVLATAGTRTTTGSVTLPVGFPGTVTAASFTVGGTGAYSYAITLLGSPVTLTSGANTMTAGNFVTLPSATGVLTAGAQTLLLGATLNVATSQAPGVYTSVATGIGVTVNYN